MSQGVGGFLRVHRTGDGKWRVFPFWYTVLALADIDLPEARKEIEYAAPVLERIAARKAPPSMHGERRRVLAARALALL